MGNEKKIHAEPVKSFFIHTITKDVGLGDCVLDLLDNCIDGAMRSLDKQAGVVQEENRYSGFEAKIDFSIDEFKIEDNCGGIPLDYAINYAFHFGRRPDAVEDAKAPIGLYGIGMKRAIFKIGNSIVVETSTEDIGYRVPIDVIAWQENAEDWDFDFEDTDKKEINGTIISIENLNKEVSDAFSDDSFRNRLIRIIARDYSFFIHKGFKITVNNYVVKPYVFGLKESADFKPINIDFIDEVEKDVQVSIAAGMAAPPPESDSADELDKIRDADYFGWYVACNDRIVLPGDKSERTVWSHPMLWHTQYYGFMGIVNFVSTNPNKLPWTTNKRDLDLGSKLYKRAQTKMKEITREYTNYTNLRKADLEKAKQREQQAEAKPIATIQKRDKMILPKYDTKPHVILANIQYQKPRDQVRKVAKSLGREYMAYRDVGIRTFNYYVENELDDE